MGMKFFVLGDRDTVLGFRLAGIDGTVVTAAEDARNLLEELTASRLYGIIIVTERIGRMIGIDRHNAGHDFPLIVDIPDRTGPLAGRMTAGEMLKKAAGVSDHEKT